MGTELSAMAPVRDADLVARSRGGDGQAFERLVVRHRSRLFAIARRYAGDIDAAQDIVQEALAKALRSLDTLREGERFGAWVGTIVRRLGLEWLREARRQPEPMDQQLLLRIPAPEEAGPDRFGELTERVKNALSVLSQRDRRVMILHYLDGYSCQEIAKLLGTSDGTIKRILFVSRQRVREECFAQEEQDEAPRGPRRLQLWIEGARPDELPALSTTLGQSICLTVNRRAKTPEQIAPQVEAHVRYVREMVQRLADQGVLAQATRGRYLASHIFLEAEDWRRLLRLVPEPAARVARRFAAARSRLQSAFRETALPAAGWRWPEVAWLIYAVFVANTAVGRWERNGAPWRPPETRFSLGGYELRPHLPPVWQAALLSRRVSSRLGYGCVAGWRLRYQEVPGAVIGDTGMAQVELLSARPRTESALCPGEGPAQERQRAALADLLRMGLAAREKGHYRLNVPLFTAEDSRVLAAMAEAVVGPVMEEIVAPTTASLDHLFDQMGYGHLRHQYPMWRSWLSHTVTGEAVRYLMEQGVLPRPQDPMPPSFAHFVWERRAGAPGPGA